MMTEIPKVYKGVPFTDSLENYLEKIRVVLVKRGDKEPQFMFETMGLDQMRLFTALGLETVLKET
jgi:hypothetical protein